MKKKIAVLFLVFSMVFISCDQDFNTIGADLVGDEHFDFDTHEVGLKAYSKPTGEVQTNNLPINPIGIYDNPYFGKTKANFVTQIALVTPNPKFGTSVQVENVTLYVPYFSKAGATASNGETTYTLDSIFGTKESKIKLSVYENGYFINNFDDATGFQTSQRYYSNGTSNANNTPIDFDGLKRGHDGSGNSVSGGTRLNDSPNAAENDQFFFNKAEIVIYKTKFNTISLVQEYVDANGVVLTNQNDVSLRVVKERLSPGIYLTLNKEFFKKKILDASASDLFNTNKFREYFKGLFFKTEQIGADGAMAMLNFNNSRLNVNYSSIDAGAVAGTVATSKTFAMRLGTSAGGNTVSLQDFTPNSNYTTGLGLSNQTTGSDSNLFLKGGKGSVVYMDLFGDADVLKADLTTGSNGVPDELDELRLKGWLINDAYLEFYIDQTTMGIANQVEAERLYLFDATNQRALIDYTFDTSSSSNSKRNKANFGGIIQRDSDPSSPFYKKGIKYKIRITQHINNLINSTNVSVNKNVKLGLCVTENIALTGNFYFKSPLSFSSGPDIEYFPVSSIMSQEGTVLHGTNPALPANANKKLKLTIHYTKPN